MREQNVGRRSALSLAIKAAVGGVAVSIFPAWAGGGVMCPACATEPTQILNNIQLVMQYAKQLQQYATQLQQYRQQVVDSIEMFRNGRAFMTHIFGPVAQDLQGIANIVQEGRALAYSMRNLDRQFRNTFKGYTASPNIGQDYRTWSSSTLDTIMGTLKAAGLQHQQLQSEQGIIAGLRTMAQNADGRMQALNVANMIAEQSVEQIQKLRALMLSDIQSKQAYQAFIVQQESNTAATAEKFFQKTPVTRDPAGFAGGSL